MKTRSFYLFLLLIIMGSSCQNKYSDDMILEYLDLNQALEESNILISNSNKNLLWDIESIAKTKIQYQDLLQKSQAFYEAGQALDQWISDLKNTLIQETGGYYTKKEALEAQQPFLENTLKGTKNSALVDAFLLSTEFKGKIHTPQASILDKKIQTLQKDYLTLLKSCWENGGIQNTIFIDKSKKDSIFTHLKDNLVLRSSKDYKTNENNMLNWAEFHFKNQALAAVLLSLTSIQNNIKISENTVLNLLAKQTTYGDLVYDKFFIYAQSATTNIQLGETYQSEIALGTYASKAQMKVVIKGDTLNAVNGIVHYSTRPKKLGKQRYNARVILSNSFTGEKEVFQREFNFEVIP